jgi:hypothetical protein
MEDVIREDGVMRLRTEEVGITVGRPSLRTSLAQGDIRAALDRDDNQREGGREIMEVYLNVIRSVETDGNNEAYSQLLEQEEEIKKQIHISEVFDFEEDNDEIGDIDDPLFCLDDLFRLLLCGCYRPK